MMRTDQRYKLLPPDGHLAIPTSSRRAAKAGLMLYTACRLPSLMAQHAAWQAVSALGARVLPGRTLAWRPPIDAAAWSELEQRLRTEVGAFDDVALHLRRPAWRAGASLLLLDGGDPVAFVKLRSESPERLRAERLALCALVEHGVESFAVPHVRAHGTVGEWHYLALSALPLRIHTAVADPPLLTIVDELGDALAETLPRPAGAPRGWRPMHGDLTPWNLRKLQGDQLVLFDWEDTAWAPPRADLLWYDATVAVPGLRIRRSGVRHTDEVVAFWVDTLADRTAPGDRNLSASVLRRLRASGRP